MENSQQDHVDNNENTNQPPQTDGSLPVAPLTETVEKPAGDNHSFENFYQSVAPTPAGYEAEATVPKEKMFNNGTSLAILGILLLTFFTPLGAALFLPLVVVGMVSAVQHRKGPAYDAGPPVKHNIIFRLVRGILITFSIFALCIIGLIAVTFILFATGIWKFDFSVGS